jgi:hypothetical protein
MKKRPNKENPKSRSGNSSPRRKAKAAGAQPVRRAPTEEEIRIRAYQRFLERGGQPGHAIEDWIAAERDLGAQN